MTTKRFIRWLYMRAYRAELIAVAKMARKPVPELTEENIVEACTQNGQRMGLIDCLGTLELLA